MPFHLNSTPLAPGSIILPGNWGRIIKRFGWQHGRAIYETFLEEIRAKHYPALPSRLESSFFFDDVGEARFYRDIDQGRSMMLLYEVKILDSVPQHVTDWRHISPFGPLNADWAHAYWSGKFGSPHESGHACREVLSITRLEIVAHLPH